ncbi:MAG: xanthine dehydrogenase [Rhodobacterales bacterium]|nr:MAG: xanthine dehydrogenase [Rhodobacterales bacterium]
MQPFGKSQPITRREDIRFLTGEGRYVDDLRPDGALRALVLRAPVAHGQITTLDVADAADMPGVHLILTAQGMEDEGVTGVLSAAAVPNRDGTKGARPHRPILAKERVRYVGEPIALIVAETLAQARDAMEMIELEIDDLPVKMDRAPGGPDIHDIAPGNVAFDWGMGDEAATDAALAASVHVVTLDIEDHRVIVNPLEPRGTTAWMEDGRLHVNYNGQGVWAAKADLSKLLGMEPDQIHAMTTDVGGGFGVKAPTYPETVAVAVAARKLERAVHWMADRAETMMADHAGRDLTSRATLGFDADYKITAYKVENTVNMGAYSNNFGQAMQTTLFAKVLTGTYDVQTTWHQCTGIFTNTTPTDAYRGAGRPEAIYTLERAMDHAARSLGVDPWELRARNFIREFPYRSATGELYDVGDFPRLLAHVAEAADRDGFAARKAASEAEGKLRGMGLAYYIESILGDPSETARVEFAEDGAKIFVGTQSNGQGHETAYAKFLSDQTGIPYNQIEVVQGDSDLIATGGGTGGSRSVTTQSNATLAVKAEILQAFSGFLAEKEGVDVEKVQFDDERFRIEGSNLSPTMLEVAAMARAEGRDDLLVQEAKAKLPGRSYPNGAHVAEVEIDPETGTTKVVRYTVVDDFGNLINPLLAEGQVHGGVAQGLGQVLMEASAHDETGQLLTASFMDYAMPRAEDMPMVSFTSHPVPSTANPMGMKGCGEAGTVGAMGAVANAVQDALWERGIRQVDMPLTPQRVWELLRQT